MSIFFRKFALSLLAIISLTVSGAGATTFNCLTMSDKFGNTTTFPWQGEIDPAVFKPMFHDLREFTGRYDKRSSAILSPTGNFVAYNHIINEEDGTAETIIRRTGSEENSPLMGVPFDTEKAGTVYQAVWSSPPIRWSPDEKYFAIIKSEGVGQDALVLFDAEAHELSRVHYSGVDYGNIVSEWSPSGEYLTVSVRYMKPEPAKDIVIILHAPDLKEIRPCWLPTSSAK